MSVDIKWYTWDSSTSQYVEITDISVLRYLIGNGDVYFENTTGGTRTYESVRFRPGPADIYNALNVYLVLWDRWTVRAPGAGVRDILFIRRDWVQIPVLQVRAMSCPLGFIAKCNSCISRAMILRRPAWMVAESQRSVNQMIYRPAPTRISCFFDGRRLLRKSCTFETYRLK